MGGKYECAGSSRIGALEGMIEIVKKIAHDYEHGFAHGRLTLTSETLSNSES